MHAPTKRQFVRLNPLLRDAEDVVPYGYRLDRSPHRPIPIYRYNANKIQCRKPTKEVFNHNSALCILHSALCILRSALLAKSQFIEMQ